MHDAFKSYSFPLLSLVPLPLILLPTSPPPPFYFPLFLFGAGYC